jgi:pilus assembly protein FimV
MMSLDMGSFAIPSSGLDVNVASATAENPTLFAADATGRGNIVFDVTAAHPSIAPNQAAPAKKSEPLSFNMDFTLPEMPAAAVSTPVVAKAPAIPAASPVVEMPFTIDFTMPKIAAVAPPPAATPVAMSGLDTIDFAISDFSPAAPAAAPAPSPMQGMDFAMMDLAAIAPIPPVVSDPLGIEMVSGSTSSPPLKLDFGDLNLNMDDSAPMSTATNMGEGTAWQEIANKLDLAKVYIEMDDAPTAREFLEEVLREGDAEQIATAQTLLKQIA